MWKFLTSVPFFSATFGLTSTSFLVIIICGHESETKSNLNYIPIDINDAFVHYKNAFLVMS